MRSDIPTPFAAPTDFGYTSQRLLDPGMGGLMDYKARFYSPYLSRFIQPDTLIPGAGNPQAWNRYSYVLNSPVRYSDPSGHMVWEGGGGSTMSDKWWKDRASRLRKSINGGRPGLHLGPLSPHLLLPSTTTPLQPNEYQASFQLLPDLAPYYYGQAAEESYTGFLGSGDNGSLASAATGIPSLLVDLAVGVRPTILRNTTPYNQFVTVGYEISYQGIPRIDAQRVVTATNLTIQNNSSIQTVINYTIGINEPERPFVAATSAGPGKTTMIQLPSMKVPTGGLTISIVAFSGCTGSCIRPTNPLPVYRGFTNFLLNP